MAMLAQLDTPTWVKLPKEIQQIIIREQCAEIANQGNSNNPTNNNNILPPNPTPPQTQASANFTETEPDDDTEALMLANIDAYLAEQNLAQDKEDSNAPGEVWGCATCVVNEGEDTAYPTVYLSSKDRQACKLHITGQYHPMVCVTMLQT